MYGIDNNHVCTVGYRVPRTIKFEGLYIPQCTSDHCLSVLENSCNHEGILTFTIILEFCSPVYKRIYFIEFISELYIEFTNLSNVDELKHYGT